jgi:CRISPR system Cascade subunit CasE
MAFPAANPNKRKDDPHWLKPYRPEDFPETRHLADKPSKEVPTEGLRQVHSPRDTNSGFLFRVDSQPGGRVVIPVLSATKPDWDYAFGLKPGLLDPRTGRPIGNAGFLLAAPPSEPRPVNLAFTAGTKFRFRLLANPTKKVHELPAGSYRKESLTPNGRRVPVQCTDEALRGWLDERAAHIGFRVEVSPLLIQPGYVYLNKTRVPGNGQRLRSARYEGILEVTDPAAFAAAIATGIGPAKAFGFGLLSVAPSRLD